MKKLLILFLPGTIYIQANAQLQEIFYDDFSSNKNNWSVGEIEKLSVKIDNGKYIVDNSRAGSVHLINRIGVDTTKNFEISISVNSLSVNASSFSGLYFGANTEKSFGFVINANGEYGLFEEDGYAIKTLIPITKSEYLKKGVNVINRFKLQKTGKKWNLIINDSLVNSVPSTKFYGPFIGIYSENTKTAYDDLKVSGTSITTSGNLCTLFPLIFQSAKNNFEYIKGPPADNDDTTSFKLSTRLQEDENAEIFYNTTPPFLYAVLKRDNTSIIEAIKYNDNLVLQMKKCLSGFVFTKSKDKDGQPQYTITEKANSLVTQPKVVLGISKSLFFTTLDIYAVPVKKKELVVVVKPAQKEIIPEVKKPTSGWIVNDDFDNNDNKWYVDSSEKNEYKFLNEGRYYMDNKTNELKILTNTFRINDNDSHDYKIETVVQNISSKKDDFFGLVFGQHGNSGFYFLVTNGGYYKIIQLADTSAIILQDLTYNYIIQLNDEEYSKNKKVKLGVIKIKDTWRFYINDLQVYSCKAKHLDEKFGFVIPPKKAVFAYSFKIYDWTVAEKFPKETKEVIYNNILVDNFFNNENSLSKNKWPEMNDKNGECTFDGRFYYIRHKTSEHYVSLHEISSVNTADYRVELLTAHMLNSGVTDKPFGLCFAASDTANMFLFNINAERKFSISKYIDSKWSYIKEEEVSDAIDPDNNDSNTLLFEQTKGKWNFYINGRLVYACNATALPGNKIGCFIEGVQGASFEHITYDKIEYRQ